MQETSDDWSPAPLEPELEEGTIDVWIAGLDQPQKVIAAFPDSLSEDEIQRAARFATPQLRDAYIAGRGILRDILSRYCRLEPASIALGYAERGKPFVAPAHNERRVNFNLSHSDGLFVCAIARGIEVGVDVERITMRGDFLRLAQRFFAPGEVDFIRNLTVAQQIEAFYECWTCKEAFMKGKGSGLHIPLDSFEVALTPGENPRLLRCENDSDDVERWSLFELEPSRGYICAVAAEHRAPTLRRWNWTPR